jgi:hypothetical protein
MQVIAYPDRVDYIASTADWKLSIAEGAFVITPIATGGLDYTSGTTLDHLAALIIAARENAIARGINWAGT